MPTHNSELFLRSTLESIINQSFKNWELIITDDCSTDTTWSIIEEYLEKDSRIKAFKLNRNFGPSYARNYSIKNSNGKYIAFCDSDDLWDIQKLEKQILFMMEKNLGFTYTDYTIIDSQDFIIGYEKCPLKVDYKKMLKNNYIGCLTAIIDSSILGKVQFPNLEKRHDWALWLLILKIHKNAYGIQENLAFYRKHKNSLSSNKFLLFKHTWNIYSKYLGFSHSKSVYFFTIYLINYLQRKINQRFQIFKNPNSSIK